MAVLSPTEKASWVRGARRGLHRAQATSFCLDCPLCSSRWCMARPDLRWLSHSIHAPQSASIWAYAFGAVFSTPLLPLCDANPSALGCASPCFLARPGETYGTEDWTEAHRTPAPCMVTSGISGHLEREKKKLSNGHAVRWPIFQNRAKSDLHRSILDYWMRRVSESSLTILLRILP